MNNDSLGEWDVLADFATGSGLFTMGARVLVLIVVGHRYRFFLLPISLSSSGGVVSGFGSMNP